MSLNKVKLMGRLGSDPDIRIGKSGVKVATFTIAVARDSKGKNTGTSVTDWFDITAFGAEAELVEAQIKKGYLVVIDGRIQINVWEDKGGTKRYKYFILADHIYVSEMNQNGDIYKKNKDSDTDMFWQ